MSVRVLELDVGNTAAKWRLLAGDRIDGGRVELSAAELSALFGRCRPSVMRVASVAGEGVEEIIASVARRAGLACRFARTEARCGDLVNSYQDVSRMGVDRWLAMLAAWQSSPGPLLVVDAGTALTIDAIAPDGRHCGGYILPGRRLLVSSLLGNTDRVRYHEAPQPSVAPGCDTASCVENASWMSMLAAIDMSRKQYVQQRGCSPSLVICGGDAANLIALGGAVAAEWCHREELVLDGLAIALPLQGD